MGLFRRRSSSRPRPADFGYRRPDARTAIAACVVGAILYYVATSVYAALLNLNGSDKLPSELGTGKSTAALVATAVFVCVLAPVAEEFFFRGFFFTALRNWHGTPLAVLLTGLTFGAVHLGSAPVVYLVPLAVLGMILCGVYLRTKSLYPCIGLHLVNNCLAFGVSVGWGWQIPVLIVVSLAIVGLGALGIARWRPAHALAPV